MIKRVRHFFANMTTFRAGLIGVILLLVFTYFGFTKFANPFGSPYTVHIIFANANQLRPASQVRIAGVPVGMVKTLQPVGCTGQSGKSFGRCPASKVTVTIQSMGLPIHKDAVFAIRPRLFLEGNFFIDLHPGSPSAPLAPSGYTFPIQQGVEPVQFDQVLTSLQADTRHNLQILLQQYGTAVKQGGPDYNASIDYWQPAYKYTSVVNHDFLGTEPHDLSTWIDKAGTVNGALDAHPRNLENLVSDFNTTALAFARANISLENAVADLPTTLAVAIPTFNALNASFPPLRRLAKTLVPGVVSTGPMVDASLPFFAQLRALVSPPELQGLAIDLRTTIPALTRLTLETIPFMRNEVRPASSCTVNEIIPWTHLTVPDSHFNSHNGFPPRKVYVEGVDFLPGLAGESRNFDSISPFIRVAENLGGTLQYSLANGLVGSAVAPLLGAQPTPPPGFQRPPLQEYVPCETQPPITNLAAPSSGAPAPG